MKDLNDVIQMIENLTHEQVQNLGVALGLDYSTVSHMSNIKTDMVHSWLIKKDNVHFVGGDPTWRSFAEGCVKKNLLGNAEDIKKSEFILDRKIVVFVIGVYKYIQCSHSYSSTCGCVLNLLSLSVCSLDLSVCLSACSIYP